MPRYYFHIEDDRIEIDRIGVELPDLKAAREEAVCAAGQILRNGAAALERGAILHDVGEEMGRVYFPRSGMVSLVVVLPDGAMVETATLGRTGVVGASAGLGARSAVSRAIVQLSGMAE